MDKPTPRDHLIAKRRYRRKGPPRVDTSIETRLERVRAPRMVQQGRSSGSPLRVGLRSSWREDLYHRALTLNWRRFLLLAAAIYVCANIMFASFYLLQPGAISNARAGSFLDAFFFSVETFGTIGYGVLAPATTYANALMTVETLVGIMLVALTTGVMFARVSRPTARVMFSKLAVVAPYNGVPTLMIRMANERTSQILQAEVALTLVRNEITQEGAFMRRFYDLKLARARTPIFALSFLVMHPMNENSPLFGATHEMLDAWEAQILVTVTGLEEISTQTVHARCAYLANEILFDHRFVNIFGSTEDGRMAIDYGRFHEIEPATLDSSMPSNEREPSPDAVRADAANV
jgi:inward rectifier potassium channel